MKTEVCVVDSEESDEGQRFIAAVDKVTMTEEGDLERVVFDCEGVDLSRIGSVELVSICFKRVKAMDVFLIDLGGKPDPGILKAVKELMETNMIVKIIHDCRMDCDALFHLHDIEVKNVHNTSCFHAIITGNQDKNLNDVLIYNGITPNAARDKSVYKRNPAFWATRPLTKHTTEWASFDVYKLFDLEVKQLERLEERQSQISVARAKSESNTTFARNMRVKTGLTVNSPGIFIGWHGSNLRRLQERTGTVLYQQGGRGTWFVYYSDDKDLAAVMRAMYN